MTKLSDLSKVERSLLLYLESRAVDYSGRVNAVQMNAEERAILARWADDGHIMYGRIVAKDHNDQGMEWVRLSPDFILLAQEERRERIARTWKTRYYTTTFEKGGGKFEGVWA